MTTENIIEDIQRLCDHIRDEILPQYEGTFAGIFAATMMRQSIRFAESAIASGDKEEMIAAYKVLEMCK